MLLGFGFSFYSQNLCKLASISFYSILNFRNLELVVQVVDQNLVKVILLFLLGSV